MRTPVEDVPAVAVWGDTNQVLGIERAETRAPFRLGLAVRIQADYHLATAIHYGQTAVGGDRKTGGGGGMAVADGHHIGAHTVEQEMHREFRRKLAVAGELPPV